MTEPTTSLKDSQITINIMARPQVEEKYIIGQDLDYDTAIQLAIQNRKTHPQEPVEIQNVEIRQTGAGWRVVRCVVLQ